MKKFVLFFIITLSSFVSIQGKSEKQPYVLLVSFDAFRYDYVRRFEAPNFKRLIANGIAAKSMISTYPSKTFANHYSIITGIQAGNNGLVDNLFYDPDLRLVYSSSNRKMVENPTFYGGLPLWQLVQQNGMKSASFFWPGSETKIAGSYPDYWKKYDESVPNEARIDSVMNWFKLPEEARPHFISLYFSITDDIGHKFGPYSPEIKDAVLEADRLLGLIMDDIQRFGLDINLVVVSDHGMKDIKPRATYYLAEEDLYAGLDSTKYVATDCGTHVRFYCKDKFYKERLYQILKSKKHQFAVYKRETTPKRWHSRDNKRVGDVLVVMKPGYCVVPKKGKEGILERGKDIGVHGYDPKEKAVQGIFYASGPEIAVGKEIRSFENVNVYPFVAELLGIQIPPNIDGKTKVLEKYIKK